MGKSEQEFDQLGAEHAHRGAVLRALREAYGWRGVRFAPQLGISQSYLSNIEAGRRPAPLPLLRRAADLLGVPLAALTSEYAVEEVV